MGKRLHDKFKLLSVRGGVDGEGEGETAAAVQGLGQGQHQGTPSKGGAEWPVSQGSWGRHPILVAELDHTATGMGRLPQHQLLLLLPVLGESHAVVDLQCGRVCMCVRVVRV